jgi:hypothetical protein
MLARLDQNYLDRLEVGAMFLFLEAEEIAMHLFSGAADERIESRHNIRKALPFLDSTEAMVELDAVTQDSG